MISSRTSRGFTLIELLVVISIISLLSSVVLASLNSARDKGRLAAGKQFAANVDHAVSDEALAMYDFEECNGSTTVDRALGSVGALTNGPVWSTDTPTGAGCSMSFNGTTAYVAGTLPAQTVSTVTYTAWVKPDVQAKTWGGFIEAYNGATQRALCRFSGSSLRPNFRINGASTEVTANASLPLNAWSHVACVYDGTASKIYINGALDNSVNVSIAAHAIDTIEIGRNEQSSTWMFKGLIDSAHAFGRSLTASEVQKLYASEASRHSLAEN